MSDDDIWHTFINRFFLPTLAAQPDCLAPKSNGWKDILLVGVSDDRDLFGLHSQSFHTQQVYLRVWLPDSHLCGFNDCLEDLEFEVV